MYLREARLQYPVKVDSPNPVFARALQHAIGGIEGEIRVCMQYFFQAWGNRGPKKYRDILLNAAEEIGLIEMLSTAVAMNLDRAPVSFQEEVAADPVNGAALNGMSMKHVLSSGLSAMPVDSDGIPFDMSHIYASGNAAADMYANVTAEATGRVLAARLHTMTDDHGMKDMLSFLIARDTMHQQQWLAALEDMGGPEVNLPIPNSFPQSKETHEFASPPPEGRRTHGPSIDGKGQFTAAPMQPLGQEPVLGHARPDSGAQTGQIGGLTGVMEAVKSGLGKLS